MAKEKGWIWKLLHRDQNAGERLVRECYPQLYRWLRCLTGSREAAEDLTQQTFLRAWEGLPKFRGASSIRTWLHRIAYHEYTHWLRDRKEESPLDAAEELGSFDSGLELEQYQISEAMSQLSTTLREAFILYHIQEFSLRETADILGIAEGTAKSRLFLARQRMRNLLSHEEPTAQPTAIIAPSPSYRQEVLSHELPATQSQHKA